MKLILELSIAFCLLAACLAGELRYNCTGDKVELSEELKVFYDTGSPLRDLMLQGSLRGLQGALGTKVRVSRLPNIGTQEGDLEVGHIHKLESTVNRKQVDVRPKPKPNPTSKPPHYTTTKSSHGTTPKPPPNPDSTTTAQPNPNPNPATTATPNPPNPNPETTAAPNPNPETTAAPNPNPETTAAPNPNPETTVAPNPPSPATTTAQEVTTPRPIPIVTTPEGLKTTEPVSTTPEGRKTIVPVTTTRERRRTTPAPAVLDLELRAGAGLELTVRIREEERRENGFRLSIGQTRISLSADSLAGALRGLEALVELRESDRAGGNFLSQCEVY